MQVQVKPIVNGLKFPREGLTEENIFASDWEIKKFNSAEYYVFNPSGVRIGDIVEHLKREWLKHHKHVFYVATLGMDKSNE